MIQPTEKVTDAPLGMAMSPLLLLARHGLPKYSLTCVKKVSGIQPSFFGARVFRLKAPRR